MEVATIGNQYPIRLISEEHDWIHLLYIGISGLFFVIEVCQRLSVEYQYKQKDLSNAVPVPSFNRYPTAFTASPMDISIAWYIVFAWQATWMIYSLIGICRRTSSGIYFYRHPCAMNKWCFFYTAFALILYTPQLAAAARNKYGIGISIFRHLVTLCEVIIILVVVHVSLWENLREYLRYKYFSDVWLTRLFYHNGLAAWASVLFYESCLSIIIGLIYSQLVSSDTACLVGCSIYLCGILFLTIVENVIFPNSLAFTLSPWLIFLWLSTRIVFRDNYDQSASLIVHWFIRVLFGITFLLALLRLILFFWRYKEKSIPTFQSPRIYSLIHEPRPF